MSRTCALHTQAARPEATATPLHIIIKQPVTERPNQSNKHQARPEKGFILRQSPRRVVAGADDVGSEGEVPAVAGDPEGLEQQERRPERARVERVVRHLAPRLHPRLLHHLQPVGMREKRNRAISRAAGGRAAGNRGERSSSGAACLVLEPARGAEEAVGEPGVREREQAPEPRGPVAVAAGGLGLGDEVGEVVGEEAVGHGVAARAPTPLRCVRGRGAAFPTGGEPFGGLRLLASPTAVPHGCRELGL